jgi:hypothetical protein
MARPPKGPTLSRLIADRQALHIGCIPCGRDRFLSPLEAVASYGGQITFAELRALIRARCGSNCQAVAEPSILRPDELTLKKNVP